MDRTRISGENVECFLRDYGWSFHSNGRDCWVTGWQAEQRAFPLIITLTDTWLSLMVAPLMKLGVDWNAWPEVTRHLLELNHDCKLVKLGIDEFGDISLSLYVFSAELQFEEFSDAIGVIGHYAERLFDDLYRQLDAIGFEWNQPVQLLV